VDVDRFCLLFQKDQEKEALSIILRSTEEDEEEIIEFKNQLLKTNLKTHPRKEFLEVVLYVLSIPREHRKVSLLRDTKYWGKI